MITNMSQIGSVLFLEIMNEAQIIDIASRTKEYLLQQKLDADSNLAVQRYRTASIAARNEQDDDCDDADPNFVERHDALLAGIADYLNAVSVVEA